MLLIPRWAFKIHTTLQQIYERPYNVQNKQWNDILRTQNPTKEAFRVFVVHQFRPRCQLVHNNMWCVMWNINPLQAKSVQNETCWEEFVCDVNGVSSDMPWYLNTFPSFSYTPVMRVKKNATDLLSGQRRKLTQEATTFHCAELYKEYGTKSFIGLEHVQPNRL